MRSPERLASDPDTPESLREALRAEAELTEPGDLSSLRERVLAGETPPAPSPARPIRWWTVVGLSGITAALVTLGVQQLQPEWAPPAPVPDATIEVVRTGPALAPERTLSTDVPAAEAEVPHPVEPALARPVEPTTAVETAVMAPAPAATPQTAPQAATPSSSLAEELAAYNIGLDAAEQGAWREARDAYTAYLRDWPQGRLRTEAQLGLLTATVRSSSPAAAEALASDLLAQGGLGSRRNDVLLVRAEALVQLGRCDEALVSIEDLRREPRVNAIRQACKRARRSE